MNSFACPCCGYKTFAHKPGGTYEICPVCFWEDDPVQLADPNYAGGANKISLKQAQNNFQKFGACDVAFVKNVRSPNENEARDSSWRPLD